VDSPRERDQMVERLLRQSLETPQRGGVTDACLDAETLAAWTAGGLTGSALEAVQLHVADCARCQSMAGTLARITSTVPQTEPIASSRRWLAWFIPLTAAAAAVALWFAVPGNLGRPVSDTELARVESAPAPPPRADVEAKKEAVQAPNEPAAPPAADRREGLASPPAAPAPESAEVRSRSDAAPQPARQEPALEGAAAKQEAPAAAAPAAAAATPLAERANVARSALSANIAAPDIVSPDPAIRWRILGAAVQHSSNGGSTWEAAPVGIAAEMTAGAAPAATVCWLVGRNGVVLLTTDGRTWRRVPFPEMTDLSAVRAVDAGGRVASVSTTDGRTFVTTDAGATWSAR
jgi:Photosynthesis system II assembly factor YCF48